VGMRKILQGCRSSRGEIPRVDLGVCPDALSLVSGKVLGVTISDGA
jgi:hypothetical protein